MKTGINNISLIFQRKSEVSSAVKIAVHHIRRFLQIKTTNGIAVFLSLNKFIAVTTRAQQVLAFQKLLQFQILTVKY